MAARVDKQTTTVKQDIVFSDFLNGFVSNPFSGALSKVINENAVKQSIKNLVFTNRGERLYQPEIGGSITRFLFEPMDNFAANDLIEHIKQTIINFERRVDDVRVTVTPDYGNNTYRVNIFFTLVNASKVISMELILKRLR